MRALLIVLSLLFASRALADMPPAISQIRANPNGARLAAGFTPRYYTPGDFAGKMDARQFWAQCSMATGTSVLTCGTVTTITANATVNQGERSIGIAGATFTAPMAGQYFTASGLGAAGGNLSSIALGLNGTSGIFSADPSQQTVSAQPTTFTFNSLFDIANDPGKTIYIGMAGIANIGTPSFVPYSATIQSCSSANSCTLSVNATTGIAAGYNDWVLITIGTDDSAACTKAVQAALTRHDRFIGIPGNTLAPSCTKELEWVSPRGEGQIYFPPVRRFTIPPEAGAPPAPDNAIFPKLHLPNTVARVVANGTATCVVTGDSLNQLNPAISSEAQTLPAGIMRRMDLLSPKIRVYERGVGGYTEVNFDSSGGIGNSNAIGTWAPNTATSWLGSPTNSTGYIYSLAPSCLFIGFGNNDAGRTPYSSLQLYDYVANIRSWASPAVDVLFSLSWPKDLGGTTSQDQWDSITMFRRTFAEVNGIGVLDFNRTAILARDGYDPVRPALTIFPFGPTNQNGGGSLSTGTYTWPVATSGYQSRALLGSTAPNWFAAAVNTSPNGVGELIWEIGCNLTLGATCGDNVVRIGIDNAAQGGGNTGNAYIECDPDYLHPGAGCRPPLTTAPAVAYSQTAVCSMAASTNSLTCTTNQFVAGDEGNPIVVPGVGPAMKNGFIDYLFCNAHFVSATNVTCFTNSGHGTAANATTSISAVSMQIGRGNPHIVSVYSITSDAAANPLIGITVNGDFFDAWYEDPNQPLLYGHAIRFGGNFQPKLFWTGTAGTGSNLLYFVGGGGQFVETPQSKLFTTTLNSFEVNGPPTWTGDNAVGFASTYSGAAENHPATLFGATVINPVIDAQNLCVTCQ
jgi:hypothetical protein